MDFDKNRDSFSGNQLPVFLWVGKICRKQAVEQWVNGMLFYFIKPKSSKK